MAKILIIEDVEEARDSICRTLERNDYEAISAPDGKAGLRMVEQHNPDLVITDIFMPEMEGLEIVRILAKAKPKLPIIAMTGSIETPYLRAALSLGAVHGLYKPFGRHELLSVVGKALSETKSQ